MDIKITKIISTIHFLLMSFIIFITLVSTSLLIALQHGIVLKELKFSNLHIQSLHVNYKKGFNIHLKSMDVTNSNDKKSALKFDYQDIHHILHKIENYLPYFNTIDINALHINENLLMLEYTKEKPLHVRLSNKDISL
ncbi:MAG: hypothetical protein U9R50_09520, partial [Campylobacterota bacterium]|nr:hypothetical protein [Campylobacterota bacterium]